ncbi:MAG: glycosyl hydrolase family 18 protein [Lacrimispora sp.]|uniref:glycosyl hydrolase n=1 Tax=Lacrimispora sp. TaxID=2719234 RepID=UPI0039E55A6F
MKSCYLVLAGILSGAVILAGCVGKGKTEGQNVEKPQNNQEIVEVQAEKEAGEQKGLHVWSVYWDSERVAEYARGVNREISSVSYFAAYFDKDKNLFIPEGVSQARKEMDQAYGEGKLTSYLSFVNDLLKAEGGSSLKDTELLYHLLSTKEARESHIKDILEMTEREKMDGIEIDYEAIRKDMDLWKLFVLFIDELYQKAESKNLLLRVILEPGAPVEEISLTKGPEYVLMCYNLYGYGTPPGPKADREFLLSMVKKAEYIPGEVGFAVSNGGFDFLTSSDGTAQIATEAAKKNQELSGGNTVRRDEASKAVVYSYRDDSGKDHEVWYADDETLNFWYGILENAGVKRLSLWRLGG